MRTPEEATQLPADENAVLVAGPGAGKTRKIEERVRQNGYRLQYPPKAMVVDE